MSFRYLSHTGDVGATLEAPDLQGIFQSGADLFRDLVVGDSPVAARESHEIDLGPAAIGDEDSSKRFFDFLRELLFLYDTERFLPARVELQDESARALVLGESFDPERHRCERELKAVTHHQYAWQRDRAGVRARVVFDI